MPDIAALIPILDLQGEIGTRLMRAGLSQADAREISADILDLVVGSPLVEPSIRLLYTASMTNIAATDKETELDSEDLLDYNPNRLFDTLMVNLRLKNDVALSRVLDVAPPVISKIRHHRLAVGAALLIRMHEVSNLSIRELRSLMGDRRPEHGIGD